MDQNSLNNKVTLLDILKELAMDLHWTWSHTTDKVWRQLDPVLWELTHNPLVVLQTVSNDRIHEVLDDPLMQELVEELVEAKRQNSMAPAWFQNAYPHSVLTHVAYFSMEFMLSEALPIYSGGLGNVAGDHLKTASDLGVPVIGIGLLYQQGYPRQVIYQDGTQLSVAPFNDPGQLPITPLRKPNGEWLRIEVQLPGYSVWLRTWVAQVGRVKLLLLDSNDSANFPIHRGITNELYGGDAEMRLMQELVLGIGGWHLLKALGLHPEVCHLNEGHSAFMIMARALSYMEENDQPFDVALNVTRSGNVFTTHTAVGAGFDLFAPSLIEQYLGSYIRERLKISLDDFLALGRKNPLDESESFNTAYLAISGSGSINGVSRLHGKVSRQLFAPLFLRWPIEEVPIGHVTNGVHMPTWDSPEADRLWTEACGKDRWLGTLENLEQNILCVSNKRLWELRTVGQEQFIQFIRKRYARQLATVGMPQEEIENARHLFDPEILIMGFARRFAGYKRPNFLLKDPDRLKRILLNKAMPVQLILAGKAHPGDNVGQAMIKEWVQFMSDPDVRQRIIFLSDYDMLLTEHLVQGVDLWINTPRRPWEACGTSGMKVLVNGGLNVSELDGWWDEAYSPAVGWAIGDRNHHETDVIWDNSEAIQLYDLLENQIIPEFYTRNQEGIPEKWVNRMRESMARLTPLFSANRSLREYTEKYYLPAAMSFVNRSANKGELGLKILEWKNDLNRKWQKLLFKSITTETKADGHYFNVEVILNDLPPEEVCVELYANGSNGSEPIKQKMKLTNTGSAHPQVVTYTAKVMADIPVTHYTPRVIPVNELAPIPLECSLILWSH
jgi:glycogen phosphorylase